MCSDLRGPSKIKVDSVGLQRTTMIIIIPVVMDRQNSAPS